jgi:hypothetical protein
LIAADPLKPPPTTRGFFFLLVVGRSPLWCL